MNWATANMTTAARTRTTAEMATAARRCAPASGKWIFPSINCKMFDDTREICLKIKNLVESNCSTVRLNFKSFIDEDIERIDKLLTCIKAEDKSSNLDIIIDIPSTKNKYRIHVNAPIQVKKDEDIWIYSKTHYSNSSNQIKVANVEESFFDCIDALDIGEFIYWGDGEGKLRVIDKGNMFLKVKAENNFFLFDNKSLSKFYKNIELEPKQLFYIKNIVNTFNIKAIFLSFCESPNELEYFKKLFPTTDICAKIETQTAINYIDSILDVSDGIMIARGDLALNSSIKDFLLNQNYLAKKTHFMNKKLYVATDILMSLNEQDLPSRADLCDFELLQSYSTYAIILKSSFFHKKRFSVINKFIESVSEL